MPVRQPGAETPPPTPHHIPRRPWNASRFGPQYVSHVAQHVLFLAALSLRFYYQMTLASLIMVYPTLILLILLHIDNKLRPRGALLPQGEMCVSFLLNISFTESTTTSDQSLYTLISRALSFPATQSRGVSYRCWAKKTRACPCKVLFELDNRIASRTGTRKALGCIFQGQKYRDLCTRLR